MIDAIEDLMDDFNREVRERPQLREGLEDLDRTIQIEFTDDEFACHLQLHEGVAGMLCPGVLDDGQEAHADLRVITSASILKGIVDRTIDPVKAYYNDEIRIKGSLFDKLRLKRILSDQAR